MISQAQITITDLFDGESLYTWVKYADDIQGTNMSDSSVGKTYMGVAYNQLTQVESNFPGDYTWSLIKGDKGDPGVQGPTGPIGVGISSINEYYLVSTASTGVTTATAGWSATIPTMTATLRYLWNYEKINYTNGTSSTNPPILIGVFGNTGGTGAAGKGISSITEYYLASAASSGVTTAATGWTTTPQAPTSTNKYLWNYEKLTWSDNSVTTVNPIVIGVYGDTGLQGERGPQGLQGLQGPKGDTGIQGPIGPNGLPSYTHIAYATSQNGDNFSTSHFGSATYLGMYVDSTAADSTDYTKYEWSLIKGADGSQGVQGPKGNDGLTPYFHTAWATNATGSTGFSTTVSTGKTYIGTYTDYTAADSSDPTKYSWVLIKGDKGDTGSQGPAGPTGQQGIQGPKGLDGTSQYVHIRYSANANGNPMTTLPDSTTKYIGITNTTTATAPTSYASYSWTLVKGEQGNQGIVGPKGTDGVTTYTWVKYADDELGNGLTDTSSGKRYIGLAFNKTTQTESSVKTDYVWSPLYDNVVVGGRNLILNGNIEWTVGTVSQYGFQANFIQSVPIDGVRLRHGDDVIFSCEIRNVPIDKSVYVRLDFYRADGTYTTNTSGATRVGTGIEGRSVVYGKIPNDPAFTSVSARIMPDAYISNFDVEYRHQQLERGNVLTDFQLSPEDIQAILDKKAALEDLENLADIVSDVSSKVNAAAGMGEFQAMKEAFDARVALDILDKEQLAIDLATIEGRTTLIETLAGENKLVTEFIETVISESEEGIYIARDGGTTGILIGVDRISFMDNGTEVAYISNQTMQINHGIFVETATIANFKFELIPGTTILGITWVGE